MGQEQLIKEMVLSRVTKCEQCGVDYDLPDVNVLGHKEDLWFLMLVCAQCHQAVGVAAVVGEQGHQAPADERRQNQPTPEQQPIVGHAQLPSQPVTKDDVTVMHEFLEEFDGNFKDLFKL